MATSLRYRRRPTHPLPSPMYAPVRPLAVVTALALAPHAPLPAQAAGAVGALRYEIPPGTEPVNRSAEEMVHARRVGSDACFFRARATPSAAGDAAAAFREGWGEYARQRGATDPTPPATVTTSRRDGWTVIVGRKPAEPLAMGLTVGVVHATLWAPGTLLQLVSVYTHAECASAAERFAAAGRGTAVTARESAATAALPSTAVATAPAPARPQPVTPAASGAVVGTVDAPPPTTPGAPPHTLRADTVRRVAQMAPMPPSLAGTWEQVVEPRMSVRYGATGRYEHDPAAARRRHLVELRRLRLGPDGRYTFERERYDGAARTIARTVETGRYAPAGEQLRFEPGAAWEGSAAVGEAVRMAARAAPPAWGARHVFGTRDGCCSWHTLHLFLPGDDTWEAFRPVNR